MRLARICVLAAAAALLVAVPSAATTGELRTLVILATWGPQPLAQADVQTAVFTGARDFLDHSSFGQVKLSGETTPWLPAFGGQVSCLQTGEIATAARAAAVKAGYVLDRYDRFVYVVPRVACDFVGRGTGNEVWLIGEVWAGLVAHELGHTFGLGHANRWECKGSTCRTVEYGDKYSVMGGLADGQYDTYEKYTAGWLTDVDVTFASAPGTYTIDQLEQPSDLPQALVIRTAANEYWLDHREPILEDAKIAGDPAVNGVFVHAGPNAYGLGINFSSPYSGPDVLLPNPRTAADAYLPGDVISEPGAFRATVLRHEGTHVVVDFRWTDTQRPAPPRITSPGATVRTSSRWVEVDWQGSRDAGSGVDHYELWIDGGKRRSIDADFRLGDHIQLPRPKLGRHGVRMVAIDRAGNRSAVTLRRFTVRR